MSSLQEQRAARVRARTARQTQRALSNRQKSQVKRLVNTGREKKYEQANGSLLPPTTGLMVDLFTPLQGDTADTRTGDDVQLNNIKIKYHVNPTGDPTNVVRVILFQYKLNSGYHVPIMADVLETAGNVDSDYKREKAYGCKILYDRRHAVGTATNGVALGFINIPARRLIKHVSFNPALGAGQNKIYMLVMSDSAVAAHPTVDYYSMIEYTDA